MGHSRAAMKEGELQTMFEHAAMRQDLGVTVHSRDPWIVTFTNFLSDEEADAFISTTNHHFARSLAGDMVSPVRTSQQAWCQPGIATSCNEHPLVNLVHERVVNITRVPKENAEFFQVLRYEEGQFYKTHHDQNSGANSLIGVRLMTFFMYLKEPHVGGGTNFPRLNITINPRKGSALLWPNVMDHDLSRADMRTEHQALPPIKGMKFSANLWLHQYDFRGPNTHGCDVRRQVDRSQLSPAGGSELRPLHESKQAEPVHQEEEEL